MIGIFLIKLGYLKNYIYVQKETFSTYKKYLPRTNITTKKLFFHSFLVKKSKHYYHPKNYFSIKFLIYFYLKKLKFILFSS